MQPAEAQHDWHREAGTLNADLKGEVAAQVEVTKPSEGPHLFRTHVYGQGESWGVCPEALEA